MITSVHPAVPPSVMLSPKPLDEIQPNLVCELLTYMGQTGFPFYRLCHAPGVGPWGTEGVQGVKIILFYRTWSCGISN